MGTPAVGVPEASSSVILSLWVPAFIFGHVFAAFWFIRSALIKNPQLGLAGLLGRFRKSDGLPQSSAEEMKRAQSLDSSILAATDAAATTTAGRRAGGERWAARERSFCCV